MQKYTIDAENKVLGRIASEAAKVLLGKNSPSFEKNVVAGVVVEILNAEKMKMPLKKLKDEKYVSFSGYPGGQKILSRKDMIEKKGIEEVLRRAVYKMLPKNKIQQKRIKFLKISK